MNGGYSQDYQRGPPPPQQQRYPQGAYQQRPNPQYPPQGRGYDHRPPPHRANYPPQRPTQRPPPPAQQRPQEWQPYDTYSNDYNNNYDYNDQHGQYDNRYYEDQHQYDHAPQQNDYQEYGQRDDRQHQYDDRYRTHPQRPPPQQHQHHNAQNPPHMNHASASSIESRTRPKERERILQPGHESPKSVPWDNPFGAFPSKKTQDKGNRTSNESERAKSAASQPHINERHSASRPSTSHGSRQQSEASLHGRQGSSSQYGNENSRQAPQDHHYHENERQYRTPQRAMTGPIPQHVTSNYDQQHPGIVRQHTYNDYPGGQAGHEEQYANYVDPRHDQSQQPPVNARGGSIDSAAYPAPMQYRRQDSADIHSNQSLTSRHTSQEPASLPAQTQFSPQDVPNFDAIATNTNEDQLSQKQPVQPYQKPAYQSSAPNPPSGTNRSHPSEELITPLSGFSFDLPHGNSTNTSQHMNWQNQSNVETSYDRQQHPVEPAVSQFPPRSASRGDMRPPRNSNERPPVPLQQRPPPNPYANRQEGPNRNAEMLDEGYAGHQPNGYGSNPNLPSQRPPMHREQSRGGYDPRLQPDRNGTPLSYDTPSRPMTSNSGRPPVNGSGPRLSSDSNQASSRQTDPSARPVPFRPGLMQPPPQTSTPVNRPQPQPQIQGPGPNAPQSNGVVTVRELNDLRRAYQEQPENPTLGMNFAKKLVEAAKVLPNQNGGADPKQVAKNRERYILDSQKIVKRLIQNGSTEAMFYMADCHGQGLLGLPADPKEAFSLYQSAAKLGHPQAAYRVAVCCEIGPEDGGGTRRDPLKAVQWYKRAASLGDAPAMYKMGMILLKGLLGQPRNPREAITWLKRAAERADAENPHALHELALLYESAQSSDVVIRDEKYALQLFTQAADLGYKYSQFRLASAYEYGKLGCAIDPRLSIGWYSKAAAQGEHQAELALSGWYLTGSEPILQQSDTEAFLWARKAAGSGLAKAEYAMGYYTEVGIGTGVNVEEAKKWYFRAAAQNHVQARERLEVLKRGGARMQKTRVSRSNVSKHNEGECKVM